MNADVPGDPVDAVAAFVDHIETLQLGTAQCANGLNDVDTNSDTYDDKFLGVTQNFHELELRPAPGRHTITLVDETGYTISKRFEILEKENKD